MRARLLAGAPVVLQGFLCLTQQTARWVSTRCVEFAKRLAGQQFQALAGALGRVDMKAALAQLRK
jgi:hypothetical protein